MVDIAPPKDLATKYLIKVRGENKLSQRCTLQISAVTETFIRQSTTSLKHKIDECLTAEGIDVENIPGYEECQCRTIVPDTFVRSHYTTQTGRYESSFCGKGDALYFFAMFRCMSQYPLHRDITNNFIKTDSFSFLFRRNPRK